MKICDAHAHLLEKPGFTDHKVDMLDNWNRRKIYSGKLECLKYYANIVKNGGITHAIGLVNKMFIPTFPKFLSLNMSTNNIYFKDTKEIIKEVKDKLFIGIRDNLIHQADKQTLINHTARIKLASECGFKIRVFKTELTHPETINKIRKINELLGKEELKIKMVQMHWTASTLIEFKNLPEIIRNAKKGGLLVYLAHGCSIGGENPRMKESLQERGKTYNPELFEKVRKIVKEAGNIVLGTSSDSVCREDIKKCIESGLIDKICFGTDYPMCDIKKEFEKVSKTEYISRKEKEAIIQKNFEKILLPCLK